MARRTQTMQDDRALMRLALREASKGVGSTSPNPPVGCVIARHGQVLGKGWHRRAGGPHAEREALAAVAKACGTGSARRLKNATLYVTLEPCSTTGRTPPCTAAVLDAGIGRVVFATEDPSPTNAGRAARILRSQGIEVVSGLLQAEARRMLLPFAKHVTTGLPWVIAKAALSLDGRITRGRGESQWLTGTEARTDAQKLRRRSDAIIVGAETVRADNPRLTLRGAAARAPKLQPWRVVLTRSGNLPASAALFNDTEKARTLVFKRRSLSHVLRALGRRDVMTAMIEGGGNVLAQAFSSGLVDEVCFYLAPMICGTGKPVIDPAAYRGGSLDMENLQFRRVGKDFRLSGVLSKTDYWR